jgi:hypothetical protein
MLCRVVRLQFLCKLSSDLCPLLGVTRTSKEHGPMSPNVPKRTLHATFALSSGSHCVWRIAVRPREWTPSIRKASYSPVFVVGVLIYFL